MKTLTSASTKTLPFCLQLSHYGQTGNACQQTVVWNRFRDFLVPKIKKLVLIDQLVPGGEDVAYKIEVYTNGNMKCDTPDPSWWYAWFRPWLTWTNRNGTQISFKIRDFLSVVDWPFRTNTTYDYLYRFGKYKRLPVSCFRHFGKVRKVVYYVSDYSPARYPNKLLMPYIWHLIAIVRGMRITFGMCPMQCRKRVLRQG